MSIKLRGLEPAVREAAEFALEIARYNGINPTVTSGYRPWAHQKRLWDRFQRCLAEGKYPHTPECRWPANRPGDSSHNYGLSFDSWVPAAQMPVWIAIRRWVGFRVPDHDEIHAEVPGWRDIVKPAPRFAQ